MTSSHRLGYVAEHAVETLLSDEGYDVYRPRAGRPQDVGDLVGIPGVVISVKNYVEPRLGTWLGGCEQMKTNASSDVGVVWHKRRGKASPLDWYVSMSGRSFVALLRRLR